MISMLQLTHGNLPLIECWYRIKEDYPHLPGKNINILPSFTSTYLSKAEFSSCISTKIMYCNRLNSEADLKGQMFSMKLDM